MRAVPRKKQATNVEGEREVEKERDNDFVGNSGFKDTFLDHFL